MHPEWRHLPGVRIERDRRARRGMHVGRDQALRLRADPHVAGAGEDGQSRRHRSWRADDVVAPRSLVQTSRDDRTDVQAGLDAQPEAWRGVGRCQQAYASMQLQRGQDRAQVVVFVGRRDAEDGDDLVADGLIDQAAVLPDDVDRDIAHPRDQLLGLPRRQAIDERRIVGDDGDEHRCAAPFSRRHLLRGARRSSRVTGGGRRRQERQLGGQTRHRRVSLVRRLGERPRQDAIDARRHVGIRRRRQMRFLRQDGLHDGVRVVTLEGAPAGQHFVDDNAERPDVGPAVERPGAGVLRTHVSHRSRERLRVRARRLLNLRDPEIEDLHRPVGKDHDVRRLDVAMDDARLVGVSKSACDLERKGQRLTERQAAAIQSRLERFTVIEGHGEEQRPVRRCTDVVDGAHVRMIERGSSACLRDEPGGGEGVRTQVG